jgi:hypothetical protein
MGRCDDSLRWNDSNNTDSILILSLGASIEGTSALIYVCRELLLEKISRQKKENHLLYGYYKITLELYPFSQTHCLLLFTKRLT